MATIITDENFKETIGSNKIVIVDFWAEWCGPCKAISPIVDELATEFEGKALVGKVDVDENNDVCAEFGIRNIPTLLFFKDGQLVDKVVGALPKAQLKDKIDSLL